jgi:hypothetical protein
MSAHQSRASSEFSSLTDQEEDEAIAQGHLPEDDIEIEITQDLLEQEKSRKVSELQDRIEE